MRQLDSSVVLHSRDLLERHPVAPFLSLHHPSRVFSPLTWLSHARAARAMWADPLNFAQLAVCEVRASVAGRGLGSWGGSCWLAFVGPVCRMGFEG